jgi:hypothetical protein
MCLKKIFNFAEKKESFKVLKRKLFVEVFVFSPYFNEKFGNFIIKKRELLTISRALHGSPMGDPFKNG